MFTDQTKLADTHQAVHSFVAWDASLVTRPIIQPNDMYSNAFVNFPHKLGYRGPYMRHFPDILRSGLLPAVPRSTRVVAEPSPDEHVQGA